MSRLLLLFVVVPAVELVLLIEIGRRIGTLATLGLIVATGALGAYLARRQGLGVLRRMRQETAAGRLPAAPVMEGIIILVAGALLVTPGILTDAFGFFCLIPPCRELLKRQLRARVERVVRRATWRSLSILEAGRRTTRLARSATSRHGRGRHQRTATARGSAAPRRMTAPKSTLRAAKRYCLDRLSHGGWRSRGLRRRVVGFRHSEETEEGNVPAKAAKGGRRKGTDD